MQIPVDIRAVVDAVGDIEAVRTTPCSVSISLDGTAPGDVAAFVRQAFSSTSGHVRISSSLLSESAPADPGNDMAVIVAGLDFRVGAHAEALRRAGVPVMVVTTLPSLVSEIALASGHPLLGDDLVSPALAPGFAQDGHAEDAPEPVVLTEEGAQALGRRMGEWVIDTCRDKRLAFALAFPFVRRPLSLEAVRATAVQNAAIGLVVIIPGADMPIMTLNQAKMLLQIAAAYCQPLSLDRVKELAAVVGGGFACRAAARQLSALVPALGWAVKAAVGYTGTLAMGYAAVEYFEGGGKAEHFAKVAARVREKALRASERVGARRGAGGVVGYAAGKIGAGAGAAAGHVVPAIASITASAAGVAAGAGACSDKTARTLAQAAHSLSDSVTRRTRKGR